jgi:hypothetical protein
MDWMSEQGELAANEMFAMSTDKITSLIIKRLGGKNKTPTLSEICTYDFLNRKIG